jgi:hypothetical protein
MVIPLMQWTTFMEQNNQKLIMKGIIVKNIVVTRNNILI